MTISKCLMITTLFVACLLLGPPAFGLTLGQVDTFEDGTTQNWRVGILGAPHPAPTINAPSGGPAGADDNFLVLTAVGGTGPGSRLSAVNLADQWAGDYITAGINAIGMDLRNFGQSDLHIRLLFADPSAGPASNVAFSSNAVFLPAGGSWTSVLFPITPADLTIALGDATAALTSTTELRIFCALANSFPGEAIVAQLGVDNIQAAAQTKPVPESATLLLVGAGLFGLAGLRRRSRK